MNFNMKLTFRPVQKVPFETNSQHALLQPSSFNTGRKTLLNVVTARPILLPQSYRLTAMHKVITTRLGSIFEFFKGYILFHCYIFTSVKKVGPRQGRVVSSLSSIASPVKTTTTTTTKNYQSQIVNSDAENNTNIVHVHAQTVHDAKHVYC